VTIESLSTGLAVLVVGASLWITSVVTRPTLPFGVRVPASRADAPVIRRERRSYQWRVGVLTVGLTAVALGLTDAARWLTALLPLAEVAVGLACYLLAHHRIQATKQAEAWFAGVPQTVTVDTSWRTEPERFPWLWLTPAVLVLAATVGIGVARYASLPARIAVHISAGGHIDRWTDKSPWSAFSLCLSQAFVTALVAGLLLATYRSRADSDADDPAGSTLRYRMFLRTTARAVLTLVALVNLSIMLVALQIWQVWQPTGAAASLPVAPVALGTLALVVMMARMGQAGARLAPAARSAGPHQDAGRDDDRFWKGGLIYVNRDDPAVLVGKRFGIGWTFNFGNPRAWLIFAAIILAPIAIAVASRH
jgi:uncharacterized membrane protein